MNLSRMPLVSVVIVTWNRRRDILETIKSVFDQSYSNFEIIVVDNASTDDTVTAVCQCYPSVKVIALPCNTGASGGRNPGIAAARGETIFILDSDASLARDTLRTVVSNFQAEPQVGAIACKVVNAQTKELDRHAGWFFSEKDKVDQDKEFLSYRFSECGAAIRKQVFDEVGPFWELLFFGREGEEYGLRIWAAGYKILFCPTALIYHRVSPSQSFSRPEKEYFDLRNSLYIGIVHYPWWMLVGFVPLRIAVSSVRSIRRRYLRQTIPALADVIQHLPFLWKQRKPISDDVARLYLRLHRQHGSLRWDLVSWFKYKT